MSKVIEHKIYPGGGIDCLEDKCPFKRECANHYTAGEFRGEDGFTPELTLVNKIITCDTHDRGICNECDYAMLPENYNGLQHGAMVIGNSGALHVPFYDYR